MIFRPRLSLPRIALCWLASSWLAVALPPSPGEAAATPPESSGTVLAFSAAPTDAEFYTCRLLPEPLLPMGGPSQPDENSALASALLSFSRHPTARHLAPLREFLASHPASVWRISVLTNLGLIARSGCLWTEALAAWQEAWSLGQAEADPQCKRVVDTALGQLLEMNARLGRLAVLEDLLGQAEGRDLTGPAAEKFSQAKSSLYLLRNEPTKSYRCGPLAVGQLWVQLRPGEAPPQAVSDSTCTDHGTSLAQLVEFASQIGLPCQAAFRAPGAEPIVPAVVHWQAGHFAALTQKVGAKQFAVADATFNGRFVVDVAGLDQEGSGYFLVPAGALPDGWRAVDQVEAAQAWGKGSASAFGPPGPAGTGPTCGPCMDLGGLGGRGGPVGDWEGGAAFANHAMAGYNLGTAEVNLMISDTPVYYAPPHGPAIGFTARYSQRDVAPTSTPNYSNLGPQWNFDWVSFVIDDPANSATSTYGPGGGNLSYTGYSGTATAGSFAPQQVSQAILSRTSSTTYTKTFPDGAKQIFGLADSSTPRRIFMTEYDDPAGNALHYTYDTTTFRLLSVSDALGQVTTLAYGSNTTTDPKYYLVTQVTDPFGRGATLTYNAAGQLSAIIDPAGLASQFSYGASNFIVALTTPYGVTTFASVDAGSDRSLLVTDPEGAQEYLIFKYDEIAAPDAGAPVPAGMLTNKINEHYRTSYYWDKKAYQDGRNDFSKAHLTQWCHVSVGGPASNIPESEKAALENRIYYNYPGQTDAIYASSTNRPSAIGRVLDDGTTTQLTQVDYNAQGHVTRLISPGNGATPARTTTFTYAVNAQDLLAVYQENATGASSDSFAQPADLLYSYTYDTLGKHLILTTKDAAGQITTSTYNSYGQPLTITNAKNETTTFTYDRDQDGDGVTDGYLTKVTGATSTATTQFTYDAFKRVQTVTDSEGYAVTLAYDATGGVAAETLDRVAKVTYPDGTYEQTTYDRLLPQWMRDRLGRWTEHIYNARQQLSVVIDPLMRQTVYDWCTCGALESIIDPNGNQTTWMRDVQGRVTQKIYADNTSVSYTYENTTSRLKSSLDAKGQRTNYTYNIDNTLAQVTYTNNAGAPLVPATPTVTFAYDAVYPRVHTMVDGVGTTTYTYNSIPATATLGAGRLGSVDGVWTSDTTVYSYDELGRVASRVINGGNVTSFSFDSLDRLSGTSNGLGNFTYVYVRDTGRLDHVTMPNAETTQYSYFPNTGDQRLQEIKYTTGTGTVLSQHDYTYNAVGDILTWTLADSGQTHPWQYTFGYDAADQLKGALQKDTSTGGIIRDQSFRYDAAGNRTVYQDSNSNLITSFAANNLNQLTAAGGGGPMRFAGKLNEPATVTVGGNPATVNGDNTFEGYAAVTPGTTTRVHIVATDGGGHATDKYADINPGAVAAATYTYDPNGNTLVSGATTYGWDAADRLITITSGGNITQFDYDGAGRRVREKLNNAEVRHWVWCGMALCEERDAGNNVTKKFYAEGQRITGAGYFYHRDHLGTVRELTDNAQVVRARYDYNPTGHRSANLITVNPIEADFGFTGHYYHVASTLHLAPFRAYDSLLGRWLSRDPIGESAGPNIYGYVNNNPLSKFDPLGLDAFIVFTNGDVKQVNSGGAFNAALKGAADSSIQSIIFPDGHGSGSGRAQGIDRNDPPVALIYATPKGSVELIVRVNHKAYDLANFPDLVRSKIVSGGTIQYYGCDTDAAINSLVKATSVALPGVTVIGTAGGVLNDEVLPLGDPNKYQGTKFNSYFNGMILP